MKLGYSILLKIKERFSDKRLSLLTIISISVGLYFTIMFLSKFERIDQDIHYYRELMNNNAYIYTYHFDEDKPDFSEIDSSVIYNGDKEITYDGDKILVKIIGLDNNFNKFYNGKLFTDDDISKMDQLDYAFVGTDLARKHKLVENSKVTIDNNDYVVFKVVDYPDFRDALILFNDGIIEVSGSYPRSFDILSNDKFFDTNKEPQSLKEFYYNHVVSNNSFKAFIVIMSTIFIFISLLNVYLIILTNIEKEIKNRVIRSVFGERANLYSLATALELTFIVFISYHLGVIFYYLLKDFVPNFFYFELSFKVYILEMIFLLLISFLVTFFMTIRMNKDIRSEKLRGS